MINWTSVQSNVYTGSLYRGGVVEVHHLILQLFNCWLSLPCNDKVANEETDDSGDDDDASNGDDDDGGIDWYSAGEDCVLKCYPPLNDEELILVTIISRSKKLILKRKWNHNDYGNNDHSYNVDDEKLKNYKKKSEKNARITNAVQWCHCLWMLGLLFSIVRNVFNFHNESKIATCWQSLDS